MGSLLSHSAIKTMKETKYLTPFQLHNEKESAPIFEFLWRSLTKREIYNKMPSGPTRLIPHIVVTGYCNGSFKLRFILEAPHYPYEPMVFILTLHKLCLSCYYKL